MASLNCFSPVPQVFVAIGTTPNASSLVLPAMMSFRLFQMKFVVYASLEREYLIAAITANLQRFAGLYEGEKSVIILQIDVIATDQRARYNGPTDEEGGWKFCVLSSHELSVVLATLNMLCFW